MDERTCKRVITVDVTSTVQAENKCSAVAMWMVRHKHSPDEGGQNYLAVVNSLPNGLPTSLAQACYSDLRANYKQFGLKAITIQIENQPANHARSTNVHRATHAHAETMHTV